MNTEDIYAPKVHTVLKVHTKKFYVPLVLFNQILESRILAHVLVARWDFIKTAKVRTLVSSVRRVVPQEVEPQPVNVSVKTEIFSPTMDGVFVYLGLNL
jgi:hypothetical protein